MVLRAYATASRNRGPLERGDQASHASRHVQPSLVSSIRHFNIGCGSLTCTRQSGGLRNSTDETRRIMEDARIRLTRLVAAAPVALATTAWGANEGLQTVGALADSPLAGTPTEQKVQAILLPGETLSKVSIWADRAKGYCGSLTAEMQNFVVVNAGKRLANLLKESGLDPLTTSNRTRRACLVDDR